MLKALSNNKARIYKDLGLLIGMAFFLNGCITPAVSDPIDLGLYNCHPCPGPNGEEGFCCEQEVPGWKECLGNPAPEPEPECIPEWCSLPIQNCNLEPLTGGVDSCGNPCAKPSLKWPNCRDGNGDIIKKEFE